MKKKKDPPVMRTPCFSQHCDGLAVVTPCKGKKIRGAKHADYYFHCECHMAGWFTNEHFALLDADKKIYLDDPPKPRK